MSTFHHPHTTVAALSPLPPLDEDGIVWYVCVATLLLVLAGIGGVVAFVGHAFLPRFTTFVCTTATILFYIEPFRRHPLFVGFLPLTVAIAGIIALWGPCRHAGRFFLGAALPIAIFDALVSVFTDQLSLYLAFLPYNAPLDPWHVVVIVAITFLASVVSGCMVFQLPPGYVVVATAISGSFLVSFGLSLAVALFVRPLNWFSSTRLVGGILVSATALRYHFYRPLTTTALPPSDTIHELMVHTASSHSDMLTQKYAAMHI
ncbi:Aste57867_12093 [Aphanomyces stellatus]|uniref:Aste57867_12093 protein n=1 Tax=Aphanomyces stellatus TaxID=120398 RepID=A0A485KV39_9STRA|nr:hypothetical protein As57867_012048 [Aphanomyces stellatus]VFT88948.1 Aste57867_12093 [Aphanomyces stellatus]